MSLSEELKEVIRRLKDKSPELVEIVKRDQIKEAKHGRATVNTEK